MDLNVCEIPPSEWVRPEVEHAASEELRFAAHGAVSVSNQVVDVRLSQSPVGQELHPGRVARPVDRAAMVVPRHLDPKDVGDRGDDVERAYVRVDDRPLLLARPLDEERYEGEVGEVRRLRRVDRTTTLAGLDADALIRGHDHERAILGPGRAEPAQECAEQLVRAGHLEQLSLVGLRDEPVVLTPAVAGDDEPGRVRRDVLAARR